MSNILRSINSIRTVRSVRVDAPVGSDAHHLHRDLRCRSRHCGARPASMRRQRETFGVAYRMKGPGGDRRAARARRRRDAARLGRRSLVMGLPITRDCACRYWRRAREPESHAHFSPTLSPCLAAAERLLPSHSAKATDRPFRSSLHTGAFVAMQLEYPRQRSLN